MIYYFSKSKNIIKNFKMCSYCFLINTRLCSFETKMADECMYVCIMSNSKPTIYLRIKYNRTYILTTNVIKCVVKNVFDENYILVIDSF